MWQSILADLRAHWWVYASMPFIAGLIGYVTKLVAIRMMFQPIEFRGIKPWFGWQGIVPRRAAKMATIACETMTKRLVKPREIFGRLDPARVAQEIEQPLLADIEDIVQEVVDHYQPKLWTMLPEAIRRRIIDRIKADAPGVVKQVMEEVKNDLDKVFDLKAMVISNLVRDKPLLNRIFQEAGKAEFRFIARCGLPFGFALGLVQLTVWTLTHASWVMPVFGLFVGWFTDWLALKMIFRPKEPTKYLGLFTWQGLFLKRRQEVAAAYGDLIARDVLTPANIIDAVLSGPLSDQLFDMIQKHVQRMIDEEAGLAKPFIVFAVGTSRYEEMKRMVLRKLMVRLPRTLRHLESYAAEAMDVRNTLTTKMQQLTADEFEGILRPVFRQDEWILITVGAVLGFLVGELQVLVMTH